jgi:hypothetical protein
VLSGPQKPDASGVLGSPQMTLRVYTGAPDDEAAQKHLDTLLDPDLDESICSLLYAADHAEAFAEHGVKSIRVIAASGWRNYQAGPDQPPLLGAEWTVEIHDRRKACRATS